MIESIIVNGLISFAISFILRYTDGPWGIFFVLREKSGMIEYDTGRVDTKNVFAEMIECYPCFTTWISLFVVLVGTKLDILSTISIWIAVIAVSLLLWQYMKRGE